MAPLLMHAADPDARKPLSIPLDRVDAIELTGVTSDHWPQNVFEFGLSDSPDHWRPVAIVRQDHLKHRRFWHSVDRRLISGPSLYLQVRYRVLPDINAANEFSLLYQLVASYRLR